jgi:hypothetical protein
MPTIKVLYSKSNIFNCTHTTRFIVVRADIPIRVVLLLKAVKVFLPALLPWAHISVNHEWCVLTNKSAFLLFRCTLYDKLCTS